LDDSQIRRILASYRRIAVVGMSKNPGKDAHEIPLYLHDHGYTIIPINPTADAILGLRSYPRLTDVPDDYDVVVIFRPSADVPPIVEEAIRAGKAKVIWMQTGIRHDEAAQRAEAAGLLAVQDRCMRTDHLRLMR